MISGCLMLDDPRSREITPFTKKQLPKLLIPLVVWNGIYFAVAVLTGSQPLSLSVFLQLLLGQGVKYHMWYIYMLLGIYLICPFLRRLIETCTPRQILLLFGIILFSSTLRPALNQILPFQVVLFGPMLEGLVGYVLLGWLLGRQELSRRTRLFGLSGRRGRIRRAFGGESALRPPGTELSPPLKAATPLPHYLIAAALFVWVRTFFSCHAQALRPAQKAPAPVRPGGLWCVLGPPSGAGRHHPSAA